MSRTLHRLIPSPAMLVALVALVVSLGSSGYASQIVPTLTGDNIKNNSVTGKQIRDLTRKDIRKRSLRGRKFQLDSVGGRAIKEFWAVVDYNGALVRGESLAAGNPIVRELEGVYRVTFNRKVRSCSYQATIGSPDSAFPNQDSQVTVSSHPDMDKDKAVIVRTADGANQPEDLAFQLAVSC